MATRVEPYTRDLLRLAAEVPWRTGFDGLPDATIHRSPTCGSRLACLISVAPDNRIAQVEQAVEACAFGQAAAHLVALHAPGMTVADARDRASRVPGWLDGVGEAPWPGLDVLDAARTLPGRRGAILLPFRALLAELKPTP